MTFGAPFREGARLQAAVVTLFPEMFAAIRESGITRRAVEQGSVVLATFNPRDFARDRHRTVDDRPYGGGPGMVMKVEPLLDALNAALAWFGPVPREDICVVYLSPQGRVLNRQAVDSFTRRRRLVLIAGRYEGVDERFLQQYVDEEWSIGDYVLSGGELPAMVLLDAVIRKLPSVLGDAASAEQDSFEQGLLDCPHYTRPEVLGGVGVPEVLLSGDHAKIERWRLQQSLVRTLERRPDLIEKLQLTKVQQRLLDEYLVEHKKEI